MQDIRAARPAESICPCWSLSLIHISAYAEENLYSYAFSGDWPRYKDIDGALHMDVNQGGGLDREWNTAEFQILEEKEDGVLVQVEYMTYGSRYLAEMTLVPQEDGTYRIDTFTYGIEAK